MQIKRFEAKNMTAALSLVKNELGPNAVILSAKSLRKGKGFFGSMKYAGVEVTAAIDNQVTSREYTQLASHHKSNQLYKQRKIENFSDKGNILPANTVDNLKKNRTKFQKYTNQKKAGHYKNSHLSLLLSERFISQDIDKKYADEILEELKNCIESDKGSLKNNFKNELASIIKKLGVQIDKNAFSINSKRIAVFIGCTGVGKTTAVAKVAAMQSKKNKKKVVVISTDNYGIAAKKLLKSYADIIRVPFEFAANKTDLKNLINQYKNADLILIDTPGLNPKNQGFTNDIYKYFKNIVDLQTHLVLSVTTKQKDIISTIDGFKIFNIDRLLFTKLDESNTYGNILNTLIETNIPLSFLCNGKKIIKNIQIGSCEKLIELIVENKTLSNEPSYGTSKKSNVQTELKQNLENDKNYFVANQKSDVYHHFECKWSKKIKKENMIQFSSARKAEDQNFLPCSSCKPDNIKTYHNFGISSDKVLNSYR